MLQENIKIQGIVGENTEKFNKFKYELYRNSIQDHVIKMIQGELREEVYNTDEKIKEHKLFVEKIIREIEKSAQNRLEYFSSNQKCFEEQTSKDFSILTS